MMLWFSLFFISLPLLGLSMIFLVFVVLNAIVVDSQERLEHG